MVRPNVIGITGGIGSGKSSAASFLARNFDICLLSADDLVHDLLEPGRAGWQVISDLDSDYINNDRSVNKSRLRSALFADDKLRGQIDSLIHPLVKQVLLSEIDRCREVDGARNFLVEVPLLFEAGWLDFFAKVVVVYADPSACIKRIVQRDQVPESQAEKAIASQWSFADKVEMADHVVNNTGSWEDTELQLLKIGQTLWPST